MADIYKKFKANIQDFSVDFDDSNPIIGVKAYPKGYFTAGVLNTDKALNTKMLTVAVPIFDTMQELAAGYITEKTFDRTRFRR